MQILEKRRKNLQSQYYKKQAILFHVVLSKRRFREGFVKYYGTDDIEKKFRFDMIFIETG